MRRAIEVILASEERSELEAILRAGTSPQRLVRRAQAVLLAADGFTNKEIASQLAMSATAAARWRLRFGGSVNRCVKRVQAATPSATSLTFTPSS